MQTFEWVTTAYFGYLLVLAWVFSQRSLRSLSHWRGATFLGGPASLAPLARLPAARRWKVTISALSIFALLSAAPLFAAPVRDWLPLLYVLSGYWASGLFFVAPMLSVETRLAAADRRLFSALRLPQRLERAPRAVLEYLEAVYFATPVFLPAGLMTILASGHGDLADRYWTIVLLAEFGAFGVLPWVQTRAPWELEPAGVMDRRALIWRQINRRVTRPFTIRVNTFPSGHASATLAVAIAVIAAAPVPGFILLLLALSVAVGSVVGRYHYGADAVAGVMLALLASGLGTILAG